MSFSISSLFAVIVLLICLFMGVRMLLKPQQQRQIDARLRRMQFLLLQQLQGLKRKAQHRPNKKAASAEAEAAIRRAQSKARGANKPEGSWEGNVYKPKRFGGKADDSGADGSEEQDEKKPRNLH
ncbi:hypothetical protein [Paucibacter sp. Y2R2-4]|uniref:hypothetical protein n=1 Tax=Paucibacter sp. Y2R2-4 TaxID=2893553 RepID=UPI0021E50806|nr:hypothetical protein [Paucibacter sp. Y2R2-4]MCV2352484.1 hypothetical protein [Paucibacter sp. Y2R2-4]